MNIRRWIAAAALLLAAPWAAAGYYQWEMVELPADSGAACGNGTPYRFFVNRTPLNKHIVLMYEGGGACWDQDACNGIGPLSASNPNGIPPDYMSRFDTTAAYGLVTPFTNRLDPFQKVQTQSWNIVYLPYCTGDVHSGSKVVVYDDKDPANPRMQFHRGQANIRGAAQWLRGNLGAPRDMLLTGFSAGGVGSTVTYGLVRDILQPTGRGSLLADSGPLMQAPRGSDPATHPSLPLHEKIRSSWGLDEPGGLVAQYGATLPAFNPDNLGSVNGALAQRYPQDRFSFLAFQADTNFSAFSYAKFYDDIANAPNDVVYRERLLQRWQPDLSMWVADLQLYGNVSYHLPFFRNFNQSHCLTIIDFSGTGIEEAGIADLSVVVDNTLAHGPVMRNVETDHVSDYFQPLSGIIRLYKLLTQWLG
ncbi:MAG: pectin acetylesterase-family hydrolase [Rubrivivax sp.]